MTLQEIEQNNLVAELKRYKHGFFLTIHSTCSDSTDSVPLTIKTVERFKCHLDDIRRVLGTYCYGRKFCRKDKDYRVVGALEVGNLGRLHAHLLIVSDHECTRSLSEIRERLETKICPHFSSVASGENAFDIREYSSPRLSKLVAYFFKQRLYFRERFGMDGLM